MSELADIESAMIDLLESLQWEGSPAFAFVGGLAVSSGKESLAAMARKPQPAALVVYGGRGRSDRSEGLPGAVQMGVLVSMRHLGGADRARLGDAEHPGGFDVLDLVTRSLDGASVLSDRRLRLIEEQLAAADDRMLVFQQRYAVERIAELAAPMYGGAAIAGSDSLVSVVLDEWEVSRVPFAFPGIEGVFWHCLGTRGRPIRWQGHLRAADDAALDAIEAGLETLLGDPAPRTMIDSWGREHADCVAETFRRKGPRRRHPVTGHAVQEFEMEFRQLSMGG